MKKKHRKQLKKLTKAISKLDSNVFKIDCNTSSFEVTSVKNSERKFINGLTTIKIIFDANDTEAKASTLGNKDS